MTLRLPVLILSLVSALLIAGCWEEEEYLELAGGGFVFNYRNAEATWGVIVVPHRDPPQGATIEVTFENPAGGEPIVVTKPARPGPGRIDFNTPALTGIEKDRPYKAVVVLEDASGRELQRLEKSFASELDQAVLPERPLAIGPGYQKNIDESTSPFPPSIHRNPGAEQR
jgi:hypothetical protein